MPVLFAAGAGLMAMIGGYVTGRIHQAEGAGGGVGAGSILPGQQSASFSPLNGVILVALVFGVAVLFKQSKSLLG